MGSWDLAARGEVPRRPYRIRRIQCRQRGQRRRFGVPRTRTGIRQTVSQNHTDPPLAAMAVLLDGGGPGALARRHSPVAGSFLRLGSSMTQALGSTMA
jgi:hypothetical protein